MHPKNPDLLTEIDCNNTIVDKKSKKCKKNEKFIVAIQMIWQKPPKNLNKTCIACLA